MRDNKRASISTNLSIFNAVVQLVNTTCILKERTWIGMCKPVSQLAVARYFGAEESAFPFEVGGTGIQLRIAPSDGNVEEQYSTPRELSYITVFEAYAAQIAFGSIQLMTKTSKPLHYYQ